MLVDDVNRSVSRDGDLSVHTRVNGVSTDTMSCRPMLLARGRHYGTRSEHMWHL